MFPMPTVSYDCVLLAFTTIQLSSNMEIHSWLPNLVTKSNQIKINTNKASYKLTSSQEKLMLPAIVNIYIFTHIIHFYVYIS